MAAEHNNYIKKHFINYIIITDIIKIHMQLSAFTVIKHFKTCLCGILGYNVKVYGR
jgi:hypothetical protein